MNMPDPLYTNPDVVIQGVIGVLALLYGGCLLAYSQQQRSYFARALRLSPEQVTFWVTRVEFVVSEETGTSRLSRNELHAQIAGDKALCVARNEKRVRACIAEALQKGFSVANS